jgi:hypothetical protein
VFKQREVLIKSNLQRKVLIKIPLRLLISKYVFFILNFLIIILLNKVIKLSKLFTKVIIY